MGLKHIVNNEVSLYVYEYRVYELVCVGVTQTDLFLFCIYFKL